MNEADTCRTYVIPKRKFAGWEEETVTEQLVLTPGRIVSFGDRHPRKEGLCPDYVLSIRQNIPKVVDNEVDDTARYHTYTAPHYSYYLTLKMVPSQLAIMAGETLVSVGVKKSQYHKYGKRTSVTIYYSREDPFVFLLEEET